MIQLVHGSFLLIIATARMLKLRGVGSEGFHERLNMLDLGDRHMDVEFGRAGIELDG